MAAGPNERKLELKDLPILRRLGQGHSGYLYETKWGGKKCARKDFPLGSDKRNELFEIEVKPLLKLDHPNIVKCLGYTLGKNSCSLVQEYVDSNLQNTIQSRIEERRKKSLGSTSTSSRVLDGDETKCLVSSRDKKKEIAMTDEDSSRCPRPEALSIIVQIATGMKHLHDKEVVHGDLKPRNVLLYSESGERKVKLADFGLSETKKRITLVSERSRHLETVTWKAPELLDDEEGYGVGYKEFKIESDKKVEIAKSFLESKLAMADVYSFGLTCSYILYSDMSLSKLKKRRMRDSRPRLPSACPEHLKPIIVSCLKSDPLSRPTFTTICAALQSYVTLPTEEMVKVLNTLGLLEKEPAYSSPLELPRRRWLNEEATDSSALEPHSRSWMKAGTAYASRFSVVEKAVHWKTGWEGQVEEAGQVDVASNVDFGEPLDAPSAVQSLGDEHLPLVLDGFDELTEMSPSAEAGFSAPDRLCNDEFEGLPHVGKLLEKVLENETVRSVLRDQALSPTGKYSALLSLTMKWKRAKVRLLFEPLLFLKDLRDALIGIRSSLQQVPSNDQIVEQLNEVISSLCDENGTFMEVVNSSKDDINNQFVALLRKKRSSPEHAISVGTWLGPDIKQELKEIAKSGGNILEELLIDVIEREESNGKVASNKDFEVPLDARSAVQSLGEKHLQLVLFGFDELTDCTKSRGGKIEVLQENAIPVAINLAKTRNECVEPAMILMEALTSPDVGEENVRDSKKILLATSIYLEYFIELMKDKELPKAGLLAAKTVVNMLVNRQVWMAARMQLDIVSAFLSISSGNENQAGVDVCLMGLSHLAKFSSTRIELPTRDSAGDKTNIIQKVLLLLSVGLQDKLLENLAKDTLVALDMEDEVSTPVEETLRELMETKAFCRHSTVVGRMAIISLMTKLCIWNQCITESLIQYLLVMIKKTGEEMRSGLVSEDLKTLQRLAVKLFSYCVKHEWDKAQSVLTENELERRTLEGMSEKEDSGIQDESRLEILEILETVIPGRRRTRITVALLVNLANSESAQCRAKVASALLKFVKENKQNFEMQDEGAFDALVALSEDENADTRGDALLALELLSRITTTQTEKISFRMLSPFLRPDCKEELKEAAAGLLALVFRDARSAKVFMKGPDSLKTVLYLLENDPTNPSSRECGYGLLKLATEVDDSIRLELPSAGLVKLIKFVKSLERKEDKELLTTVLYLLCKYGNEADVIEAEGHIFLVSSLGDNNSKEAAVRGLWILLNNPANEDAVLGVGFVGAAMRSINSNFASSEKPLALGQTSLSSEALNELALALAKISSSSKGLDEIVGCDRSEGALLSLLERCSSLEGKGAAAAVIAILYPKLAILEDKSRLEKLSNASSLLFKCLKETDKSQLKEFLKALAVVASQEKGINSIHQDRGVEYLIKHFESEVPDTEVQRLVLQIFAEMSIVFTETTVPSFTRTLLKAFRENEIGKRLCRLSLMKDNAESTINLLKIIRNYSQAGEGARGDLGADAAVSVLLEVLKRNSLGGNVPVVNELALGALAKFMEDADRKKAFNASDLIKTVAEVMKRKPLVESVLCYGIVILAKVIEGSKNKRVPCEAIFNCKVLTPLKDAMFHALSNRVKWQAVALVHWVVLHGPTSSVCTAILREGMLDVVIELLQTVPDCKDVATELLKCVRKGDRECRFFIDKELKRLNITLYDGPPQHSSATKWTAI